MERGQADETTFSVPTIDCESCARSIKGALGRIEGIGPVDVDIPAKRVHVQYDPSRLDEQQLREVVEGAGFATEEA